MAHYDLLPQHEDLLADLTDEGPLTREQATEALQTIAHAAHLWRDYYSDQYEIIGEQQELGARDALDSFAKLLDPRP